MPTRHRKKSGSKRSVINGIDIHSIRNWTVYIVRLSNNSYYIGITAYTDFMRRIRQHGGVSGSRWAKGKTVEEILEIHPIGRMPRIRAENIENDYTVEYRKRYGRNVRGGYNSQMKSTFIPNYTPGSSQSLLLILAALLSALALLGVLFLRLQTTN